MTRDLSRLLKPRSIAVVGGGAWCRSVIQGLKRMGYVWDIWPVHPTRSTVEGIHAYATVADLPRAPDAAFIGINAAATVTVVADLAQSGGGGAVCYALGFTETPDGAALTSALRDAAGDMPIFGPECHGFINTLKRVALWPDVHGLAHVSRGVAIVTQSATIARTLTMQTRGLPIAYMVTVGNQAQTGLSEIGAALLADEQVTALGLQIDDVGNLRAFEALAQAARTHGKPVVVLTSGCADAAPRDGGVQTASRVGRGDGAAALLRRLGMARVQSLEALLETLKLLHLVGPLPSPQIAALSCSGSEARLVAGAADTRGLRFAPLGPHQTARLCEVLGPLATVSNPLAYHSGVWGDAKALSEVFIDMMQGGAVLTLVIVDFPRADRCDTADWDRVIAAAALAHAHVGMPLALVSTLSDTLSEATAQRMMALGLIPLAGLDATLDAVAAAVALGGIERRPEALLLPVPTSGVRLLADSEAKTVLSGHGLCLAWGGSGETVRDAVIELRIAVEADPRHGYILRLGAGGALAELWADDAVLLLPVARHDIVAALKSLRIAPVLSGDRGGPGVALDPVVDAVLAVQAYVASERGQVVEVAVNPLIVTPSRAVATGMHVRIAQTG